MENSLHKIERPSSVLTGVRVSALEPLHWLRLGWQDLLHSPAASLSYGVIFAIIGYLIVTFAADKPYLLGAALSGFFLVGPLLAAGLYELSRRHAAGEEVSLWSSFAGWRRNGEMLAFFGAVVVFVTLCWEMISAHLFALFYRGDVVDVHNFIASMLFSGHNIKFLIGYLAIGGVVAALVFALSAVSVPMLVDREVDVVTAMHASLSAVAANPGAMVVWAAIIVALVGIGYATMMLGIVLIVPLLGHATWHAYRALVK